MHIDTHHMINRKLCGTPTKVHDGRAHVECTTTDAMTVDATGLIHGGFIFGLADYAAMLAVNDPHVVLGAAEVKFLKPVAVRDTVVAHARTSGQKGRQRTVEVRVERNAEDVFAGVFTCYVLEKHVLHPRKGH